MDDSEAGSLEQMRAFLAGSVEVRFAGQRREEVYGWVEQTLVRHHYASLDRSDKGLVRSYVARMTGRSRAQVTRWITAYGKTGRVKAVVYQRRKFPARYNATDVNLLAYVDKAHGNLSRRRGAFWSGSSPSTAKLPTSGWRRFQWRTCTGCATRKRIANATPATNPHDPPQSPSANAANHSHMARPDIYASTRCIRAIIRDARVCITSTRSTKYPS